MSSCQVALIQERQTRRTTLCSVRRPLHLLRNTQILEVLRAPSEFSRDRHSLNDGNKRAADVMIVCADTARFVFSLPRSELVSLSVPARARLDVSATERASPGARGQYFAMHEHTCDGRCCSCRSANGISSTNEEYPIPQLRNFNLSHSKQRCQDYERSAAWYVVCHWPVSNYCNAGLRGWCCS